MIPLLMILTCVLGFFFLSSCLLGFLSSCLLVVLLSFSCLFSYLFFVFVFFGVFCVVISAIL